MPYSLERAWHFGRLPASAGFLLGSLLDHADEGDMFLCNVEFSLNSGITTQKKVFFTVTTVRTSN
jgi:hypothetical protein